MTGGFTGVAAIAPIEKPMLVPSAAFAANKAKKKKEKIRQEALKLVDALFSAKSA